METIRVSTRAREQLTDITAEVSRIVRGSGVEEGLCILWSAHTTAGLTVNEGADPDVARDISGWLREKIPPDPSFRHTEGNADSHIKTSLVGPGLTLLVSGGRPVLGTWQGVFLCEFDGPRTREVHVRVVKG